MTYLDGKLYLADGNNHQIRVLDLASKKVSTLMLTNLEMLTEGTSSEEFSGRLVELPEMEIGVGSGKLTIDLNLPDGYKLNEAAPTLLEWRSSTTTARMVCPWMSFLSGRTCSPSTVP